MIEKWSDIKMTPEEMEKFINQIDYWEEEIPKRIEELKKPKRTLFKTNRNNQIEYLQNLLNVAKNVKEKIKAAGMTKDKFDKLSDDKKQEIIDDQNKAIKTLLDATGNGKCSQWFDNLYTNHPLLNRLRQAYNSSLKDVYNSKGGWWAAVKKIALPIGVALLASAALPGLGFAAWVPVAAAASEVVAARGIVHYAHGFARKFRMSRQARKTGVVENYDVLYPNHNGIWGFGKIKTLIKKTK